MSNSSSIFAIFTFWTQVLVPDVHIYIRVMVKNSPNARHIVTTAGNPSGIAATAKATAILK
jgi:hypothetical protein